jgi:hypothetical protein
VTGCSKCIRFHVKFGFVDIKDMVCKILNKLRIVMRIQLFPSAPMPPQPAR